MAYDNCPTRYSFGTFDFGGGADETFTVLGPKGKKGRLIDYGVYGPTEAFAAGTNKPMMAVGTAADQDHYGEEFDFGALALDTMKSIRTTYLPTDAGYATYILSYGELPADTGVKVTCVAGTGSGLTGMAIPFVDIIWEH